METQHPQVVSDGESPVPPCPICGKQLKNKASLYDHERRVHLGKERSDPCKFCNRVFYTGFSLRIQGPFLESSQIFRIRIPP